MKKQQLIEKLITKAFFSGIGKTGGVGYHIKNLNKKDRLLVKKLTSKDFNHRIK